VLAGPVFWPMEKAPEVLRFYRDWVADAPRIRKIPVHDIFECVNEVFFRVHKRALNRNRFPSVSSPAESHDP
jgi:hypothetical protein